MSQDDTDRLYRRTLYAQRRATGWKRSWLGPGGTKPKPSAARLAIEAMRAKRVEVRAK